MITISGPIRPKGRQDRHIKNMKKNNIAELMKEILKFRDNLTFGGRPIGSARIGR